MRQFELIFVVDDLPGEAVGHIYDNYDALVSGHSDQTLVTITVEGETPLSAAKLVVTDLEKIPGVRIKRCDTDEDNNTLTPISTTDLAEINNWLSSR